MRHFNFNRHTSNGPNIFSCCYVASNSSSSYRSPAPTHKDKRPPKPSLWASSQACKHVNDKQVSWIKWTSQKRKKTTTVNLKWWKFLWREIKIETHHHILCIPNRHINRAHTGHEDKWRHARAINKSLIECAGACTVIPVVLWVQNKIYEIQYEWMWIAWIG